MKPFCVIDRALAKFSTYSQMGLHMASLFQSTNLSSRVSNAMRIWSPNFHEPQNLLVHLLQKEVVVVLDLGTCNHCRALKGIHERPNCNFTKDGIPNNMRRH